MLASSSIPLLIFAKAPVAGQVKTRLQSHCSAEQAAEIAGILLQETLTLACDRWPGEVVLAAWPSAADKAITKIADQFNVLTVDQGAGDLGDKMSRAAEGFGYPVAIIGSDSPHMSAEHLTNTYENLLRGMHTIGPSTDGGYYLIGLAHDEPNVFSEIEWSTETVFESTISRAEFNILSSETDIDHWDDVINASTALPALAQYLSKQGLLD